MSGDSRWSDDRLSLEALERINRVCLQFEAVWKEGREPRIEDYLGATEGDERASLLRELLLLDLDYRWRLDKPATAEDYRARFPEDREFIEEILGRLSTRTVLHGAGLHRLATGQPALPSRLGDYELEELLGEGGMGTVYRARQSSVRRTVALKVVRPDRFAGLPPERLQETIRRFQVEIQAAARLEHESIVPVYEVGQLEGQPFFSMRYFEGGSLDSVIRQGPLDGREAAAVVEKIARAVQHAHSQGVIHRDLKPRNILLDSDGHPYIADFGLAKTKEMQEHLTLSGEVVGTPAYMAPEQARGEASVGMAADIYGLGATLYELITGRPPFRAATVAETQRQVIDDNPVPPRDLNSAIPRDLETICLKCLEKDPGSRYASAEEVAEELARFQQRRPIRARPIGRVQRFWRWCRRNPVVASLGAAASFLLLILAIGGPIVAVNLSGLLDDNQAFLERAVEGERRAEREAIDARKQRDRAQIAEKDALEAAAAERRQKYIADMKRAEYFWEINDVAVVRALLKRYLPVEPGEEDLRGFEWYYWWRGCHQEVNSLELDGEVRRIAVSPDGKLLAAGVAGGKITLWDLQTADRIRTFQLENADCVALSFSDDGAILAAAGGQGLVMFWDVASGDEIDRGGYPFSNNVRGCVAFDASCDRYAWTMLETLCVRDRCAPPGESGRLRAFQTGLSGIQVIGGGASVGSVPTLGILGKGLQAVAELKTPFKQWWATDERAPPPRERGGPVFSCVFSGQSNLLAAGGSRGTVKVWDLDDGEEKQMLQGHEGIVWSIAFSQDEKMLASGGADGKVVLWDIETGTKRMELMGHSGDVYDVLFVSEGRLLVSAGRDSTLRFWDTKTGEPRAIVKGHEAAVNSLAVSGEGRELTSGGADGTARIWAVPMEDDHVLLNVPSSTMLGASFSPDGKRLAWVVRNDPRDLDPRMPPNLSGLAVEKLVIWDWQRGEELAHEHLASKQDAPAFAAFSSDGLRVAVRSIMRDLNWDESRSHRHFEGGSSTGFSRNQPGPLGPGAFFPDGSTLASAGLIDGNIELWNVARRRGSEIPPPGIRATLDTKASYCLCVAVSPDGKTLAAAADEGVQLWDAQSRTLRVALEGHTDFVRCVTFSSDGKTLASAASDGTVRLWDVEAGVPTATLRGHEGGVSWAAISPDGKTVASAGIDGTIRLWDLKTGEEKSTLRGHDAWVTSVACSPDGRTLASTSDDGTVRLWRAATDEEIQVVSVTDDSATSVRTPEHVGVEDDLAK